MQRDTGNSVVKFRSDRGKEFLNNDFTELLDTEGIKRDLSAPYTPQQNGYIKRDNRTICEAARSMLQAQHLPLTLWAEAVNIAVHVLNRTVNSQTGDQTPYELWYRKKPNISYYKVFGSTAYILTDKDHRTKFEAKGERVIFVGYSSTSKAWRFWNPKANKITESADVIFDELSPPYDSLLENSEAHIFHVDPNPSTSYTLRIASLQGLIDQVEIDNTNLSPVPTASATTSSNEWESS